MTTQKTTQYYDFAEREIFWQQFWDEEQLFKFDPDSAKPLFTIDTPPPTVSGMLHLGHIYSYIQAEINARYRRLAGFNVRYPFGLDNNGLPTERLVEKELGIKGSELPLAEFVEKCMAVTNDYAKKYEDLWRSIALSVDWNLLYSTISPELQEIAQKAFKDLYDRDLIYRSTAPALYCWECKTFVAQAEVEDSERDSVFYDLKFTLTDGETLTIATTRPELLPACVAVFVNPDDKRYQKLVGSMVTTPLGDQVKIYASDKVHIDKGSGAVMCCTYGDETDLEWVREFKLPEKIIINEDGKFIKVSQLPEMQGKTIAEGREFVVAHLKANNFVLAEKPIRHAVGVHERCGTPIEILPTAQWYVKTLDAKKRLLDAGEQIEWHPAHMQKRYNDWVSNLKWDWCISRDRFFGIPIPAYICKDCATVVVPEPANYPFDPKLVAAGEKCPKCGGQLTGERGVLDTWFTSALTPEFNNEHPSNGTLKGKLLPMAVRPQGHDIIRTWAVYSILMTLYRHDTLPWKELMISGHVLLRKGEKISKKTGGGKLRPEEMIATHSADALRYAMCGAGLGKDGYFDEKVVQDGKKLVNKLFNVCKFMLTNTGNDFDKFELTNLHTTDQWIIAEAQSAADRMQNEFERYEYSKALIHFEEFFWAKFTDNYMELIKGRLYGTDEQQKQSAQTALLHVFLAVLKMISPYMPHITEELYHAKFVKTGEGQFDGYLESDIEGGLLTKLEQAKSIHVSAWPKFELKVETDLLLAGEKLLSAVAQVRNYKAGNGIKLGAELEQIVVPGSVDTYLKQFAPDFQNVAKAKMLVAESDDATLTIKL